MTIIEQLTADRAGYAHPSAENKRQRFIISDLDRVAMALTDLARNEGWSRGDLIQLVDFALAEDGAEDAANAARDGRSNVDPFF